MLRGAGGNDQIVKVAKKLRDVDVKSIETYHDNQLNNT